MDIQPFKIAVAQCQIAVLAARLAATRWPNHHTGPGEGLPLDMVREVADHWRTRLDWRAQEALLNQSPQFPAQSMTSTSTLSTVAERVRPR